MQKTVLILGTSKGIGLALTKRAIELGFKTISSCRKVSEELKNTDSIIIESIDLTNKYCGEILVEELKKRSIFQIDIFIHNAGVFHFKENFKQIGDLTPDDIESFNREYIVNTLGPIQTLNSLIRHNILKGNSKAIVITSLMGSISQCFNGNCMGYSISKAAVNLAWKGFSFEVVQQGIMIAIIHPGVVDTAMTSNIDGLHKITTQESATHIWNRIIQDLNIETTGTFWNYDGKIISW